MVASTRLYLVRAEDPESFQVDANVRFLLEPPRQYVSDFTCYLEKVMSDSEYSTAACPLIGRREGFRKGCLAILGA